MMSISPERDRQLRSSTTSPASTRCRAASRSPYAPTACVTLVMAATMTGGTAAHPPSTVELWTTAVPVDNRRIMPMVCYGSGPREQAEPAQTEQAQRIQIGLSLPHPPVQAGRHRAAGVAGVEHSDRVPGGDPVTG